MKKHNPAPPDFFFLQFGWGSNESLHMYFPMLPFNLSLCHACRLNYLSQAYILHETFKPLEYFYYKAAIKQLVGHVYVFIILTFLKT